MELPGLPKSILLNDKDPKARPCGSQTVFPCVCWHRTPTAAMVHTTSLAQHSCPLLVLLLQTNLSGCLQMGEQLCSKTPHPAALL